MSNVDKLIKNLVRDPNDPENLMNINNYLKEWRQKVKYFSNQTRDYIYYFDANELQRLSNALVNTDSGNPIISSLETISKNIIKEILESKERINSNHDKRISYRREKRRILYSHL